MIENISFGKDAAYLYAAMNYNFFIKKESDKSGKSPIYLNVRLNGKRARISTLLKIEEKHWDKEKKKVIKCDEADDYNLILKQLENRITNIIVKHRLSETPLTMDMFLNQLKNAPPSYDLVQFFEHVIQDQDLSESTIIKHKGIFNKLKNSKIPSSFPDINLLWFDKYRSYLKKLGNNSATVNTNISIIKKYLRMAKANGIKIYVNLDWVNIAKEKLYKHINKKIREIRPNFNIGISTGIDGDRQNRFIHAYRHWLFIPSSSRYYDEK